MELIEKGCISQLLDSSILITGTAGSGKTRTIQKLTKELLQRGKRICLLDFTGNHINLAEHHGKTFMNQVNLNEIAETSKNLYRITFNKEILFFKEECNVDFLNEISSEVDYVIVDEAQHLFARSKEFEIERLLNNGIKVILALENLECFEIATVMNLKRLMNELLLRQHNNDLAYLQDGEGLLIWQNQIISRIYLDERIRVNEKRDSRKNYAVHRG
ncbi:helicase HerA domain-containing protein [Ornithinibacillus contaminans]|uniref:helicase HerA domain-containing protein n=1 Tax=Ornithinibacillus contaminans TaxID=694055 RepID=UPI00064D92F3|nr:DUF87 domain-containing protein [Ornithinibacillus contaminans]